jgi:hypothetical protein
MRTEDSRAVSEDDTGRRLRRAPVLAIEAVFASVEDSDAGADDLAEPIERTLYADPTLGGLVKDLDLVRTVLDARTEGETRVGRARLEFELEYHTAAGRPDASLT